MAQGRVPSPIRHCILLQFNLRKTATEAQKLIFFCTWRKYREWKYVLRVVLKFKSNNFDLSDTFWKGPGAEIRRFASIAELRLFSIKCTIC